MMGGWGSGRWQNGKLTTIDMRALDVRRLHRGGLLRSGSAFGWHWTIEGEEVSSIRMRTESDRVVLTYRSRSDGGEWEPMEYPVLVDWTNCHLGGRRPWFLCPARGCGRRVAILYGGRIFACRHCHRLAYASQRERADDRATRLADRIRNKLEWELGILNGDGDKPKGMHWCTFDRLKARHDAYVGVSIAGALRRFGMIEGIDGTEELLRGACICFAMSGTRGRDQASRNDQ